MVKVMKFAGRFSDALPYGVTLHKGFITWASMSKFVAEMRAEGHTVLTDPIDGGFHIFPVGFAS